MRKSKQQLQDEQESQYQIYWSEKRHLAIEVSQWAKRKAGYPEEAITSHLQQYGGGDTTGRTIAAKGIITDTIALVDRIHLAAINEKLLEHARNSELFQS